MKPVVLPMLYLLCSGEDCSRFSGDIGTLDAADAEHTLVFVREHFDEARQGVRPVVENPFGAWATRQFGMTRDEIFERLEIADIMQRLEVDRFEIAALLGEVSVLVEYVGQASAHAGSEVAAASAEHNHEAVGHVFAAVIADAFDDCG